MSAKHRKPSLTNVVAASLADFIGDARLEFATKTRAMQYLRDLVAWHAQAKEDKEAAGE